MHILNIGVESVRNSIKQLRLLSGLTQAELARQTGVRRETIVFLEKGRYNPSLSLAYRISRIFKRSIEEVFELDDVSIRGSLKNSPR